MKAEDVTMPFGKYKGKSLGDIVASDPAYIDYLVGLEIQKESLRVAVAEIAKKYEPEIERALDR